MRYTILIMGIFLLFPVSVFAHPCMQISQECKTSHDNFMTNKDDKDGAECHKFCTQLRNTCTGLLFHHRARKYLKDCPAGRAD